MSKIQDAIRKVQNSVATNRASNSAEKSASDGPVGEVSTRQRQDHENPTETVESVVVVDESALQRAGYLASAEQERFLADQYRLIKRPLLDNALGRTAHIADDANLIMVTSPLPGDGKTFNCINLALSIAMERDTSVVLVDADVAKQHITRLFGVDERRGLIDVLKHHDVEISDVLIPTSVKGLSIIPAGSHDDQATELLASKRMSRMVHDLSASFIDRVVIFDSPPILVTSEARVLAGFMGQITVVVRAGRTPQQAVLQAVEYLDEEKPISLILNEAGSSLMSDGYSLYGYGYGRSEK